MSETVSVDNRLFVCGTLAPDRANDHVLENVPGSWEPAAVRGELVQLGWGADLGFPALVLREDAAEVAGFLFTSAALPEHWSRLDDFEGQGYERVPARAQRQDGGLVDAYVYVARQRGLTGDPG